MTYAAIAASMNMFVIIDKSFESLSFTLINFTNMLSRTPAVIGISGTAAVIRSRRGKISHDISVQRRHTIMQPGSIMITYTRFDI